MKTSEVLTVARKHERNDTEGKKHVESSSKKQKALIDQSVFDKWTTRVDDPHSREKVLEALKNFHDERQKLLEEKEVVGKGNMTNRLDTLAAKKLKEEGKYVNSDEEVGNVPGVEVGDQYHYRAEMVVIGLHKHLVNGISYIRLFSKCFATSIINSTHYYNNVRVTEAKFEYIGEGGNPKTSKTKKRDQLLTKGNLALKTNMEEKFPVRVIHYVKEVNKFVYDGLYYVSSYKKGRSEEGKLVFKFQMIRLANQKSSPVPIMESSRVMALTN